MPSTSRQTEPRRAPAPPRYKLALLTWAGAYAVITAILAVLGPSMATWPLLLRTLLLSVLMVVAMTWLVIPSLTRLFRGWLVSASSPSARAPSPHRPRKSTTRLQPGDA
jgi:antibiotic biosynthesis monooxygenase (ABM) superfamily enzyme